MYFLGKTARYILDDGRAVYDPGRIRKIQVGQGRRRTLTDMVVDQVTPCYEAVTDERQVAWLKFRMGVRHPLDVCHALRYWGSRPGMAALALFLDLRDAFPMSSRNVIDRIQGFAGFPREWRRFAAAAYRGTRVFGAIKGNIYIFITSQPEGLQQGDRTSTLDLCLCMGVYTAFLLHAYERYHLRVLLKLFADDVGIVAQYRRNGPLRMLVWIVTVKTTGVAERVTGASLGIRKCQILVDDGELTEDDEQLVKSHDEDKENLSASNQGIYLGFWYHPGLEGCEESAVSGAFERATGGEPAPACCGEAGRCAKVEL